MAFTSEQILALAPDAASASAGRGLANTRKWVSLGGNEAALWGECQGSGSKPYQTQIDLSEPAFKCSCPSRKFPCKHGLGLFLLYAAQADAFTQKEPPDWVAQWLESRAGRAEKAAERAEKVAAKQADPAAQAKRAAQRENKVGAGLQELELWLADLIRGGLAQAQGQPYSYWNGIASRMIDAQAPGLARRLRELGGLASGGPGWQDALLAELGEIHLILEAYRRLETLPPGLQEDVRAIIGWTVKEEELAQLEAVADVWLVIGQRVEEEENLRVGRSWLWGRNSRRFALVLQFAHASQSLSLAFLPGTVTQAEIVFYPGSRPLRAAVRSRSGTEVLRTEDLKSEHSHDVRMILEDFGAALAANPWTEAWPGILREVLPVTDGNNWAVRDAAGDELPLPKDFARRWHLLAASGGAAVDLFGEWNGRELRPFGAYASGTYIRF